MALYFSANNNNVRSSFSLATSMTYGCWFWALNNTGSYTLMSSGRSGTSDIRKIQILGATAGDPVRIASTRHGSGEVSATTSTGYLPHQWSFICGTENSTGDNRNIYLWSQGKWSTANSTSNSDLIGADTVSVGDNANDSSGDALAIIAYPFFYNVELSFDIIRYMAFQPFIYRRGLSVAWAFNGGSGERDHSGNNRHGVISTAPPVLLPRFNPPVRPYLGEISPMEVYREVQHPTRPWINAFISAKTTAVVGNLSINVNDSVSLTESVSVNAGQVNIAISDNITVNESIILNSINFITVSDSIVVNESVNILQICNINVNDSISLIESVTLLETDFININDTVTCEDALSCYDDVIFISESVTVTLVSSGNTLTVNVSDDISIVDIIILSLGDLKVSINDNISLNEFIKINLIFFIRVNENISLVEDTIINVDQNISLFDSLTANENVILSNGLLPCFVFDSITTNENLISTLSDLVIFVNDSINAVESLVLNLISFIDVNEDCLVQENLTSRIGFNLNLVEVISLTESIVSSNILDPINTFNSIQVEESLTIVVTQEGVLTIIVNDSIVLTDFNLISNAELGSVSINDSIVLNEFLAINEEDHKINSDDSIIITEINNIDNSLAGIDVNDSALVNEFILLQNNLNTSIFDIVVTEDNSIIANTNLGSINISDSIFVDEVITTELPGVLRNISVIDSIIILDSVTIDKQVVTLGIIRIVSKIYNNITFNSKVNSLINLSSVSKEEF